MHYLANAFFIFIHASVAFTSNNLNNVEAKDVEMTLTENSIVQLGNCVNSCDFVECPVVECCLQSNDGNCKMGYKKTAKSSACLLFCVEACIENAECSASNVCACKHSFVDIQQQCKAICGQSYYWNASTHNCTPRCKPGIIWDSIMQMCVERLQGTVELIAVEVEVLMKDTLTSAYGMEQEAAAEEDQIEGAGDNAFAIENARTENVGFTQKILESLAFSNTTDAADDNNNNDNDNNDDNNEWDAKFPTWFTSDSMLIVLAVLTLLMTLSFIAYYFWKRHTIKQYFYQQQQHEQQQQQQQYSDIFESENYGASDEYVIDRHHIMVY